MYPCILGLSTNLVATIVMSEPQESGFRLDSMMLAGPVSILFFIFTIFLFRTWGTLPSFHIILWTSLPILAFLVVSLVNLASQQATCRRIDAGAAFKGGVPSIITTLLGLLIASVSYCRIPVASVFAPLIAGEELNIVQNNNATNALNAKRSPGGNAKRCCTPRVSLEYVEKAFPEVAGCDYGFYVMFAILFGFVFGNSMATIC